MCYRGDAYCYSVDGRAGVGGEGDVAELYELHAAGYADVMPGEPVECVDCHGARYV